MRFVASSLLLAVLASTLSVSADPSSGRGPPEVQPLISRANTLFSSGQFNDAARAYSEAIELSPADYVLYYKRATSYYSLNRHTAALDDFEKVLSLTSNSFDNAYVMKARIHLKDGDYKLAQDALSRYTKSKGLDSTATELQENIAEGQDLSHKLDKERKSQLWTACVDTASAVLRYSSHAISIRQTRAECALAAGDIESAVGDLTRLSHLLQPSTPAFSRIVRLAYFLLPSSQQASSTLKQCLHYDPDSKPCLTLHRLVKAFDRGFTTLEQLQGKEDWRGIVQLLTASGKNNDLLKRFDDALTDHATRESLLPPPPEADISGSNKSDHPQILLPDAMKFSPRRQTLFRVLCKAYTHLNAPSKAEPICEALLGMDGCAEDVDGLIGRGESLLKKQEYEEAVRTFEKAFEASGRSNRDVHQRLSKAQKLLKQSKQKDYYKVLGVARDADLATIRKAFRNAAKTAHPDKGGSESKMAAVNEAYEVLSDPELRARFDAGDDPNDPTSGQGGPFTYSGSGHPFAQFFQGSGGGFPGGGHPGGHGGFQFHF